MTFPSSLMSFPQPQMVWMPPQKQHAWYVMGTVASKDIVVFLLPLEALVTAVVWGMCLLCERTQEALQEEPSANGKTVGDETTD